MEFEYLYDDTPAVGRAIIQAIGAASMCWENVEEAGQFDIERALAIAQATAVEVRRIVTFELAALLDVDDVAHEWNTGVEAAIRTVEDLS
jgi:hypothetical protein